MGKGSIAWSLGIMDGCEMIEVLDVCYRIPPYCIIRAFFRTCTHLHRMAWMNDASLMREDRYLIDEAE